VLIQQQLTVAQQQNDNQCLEEKSHPNCKQSVKVLAI